LADDAIVAVASLLLRLVSKVLSRNRARHREVAGFPFLIGKRVGSPRV
jgi:hypothetical protein